MSPLSSAQSAIFHENAIHCGGSPTGHRMCFLIPLPRVLLALYASPTGVLLLVLLIERVFDYYGYFRRLFCTFLNKQFPRIMMMKSTVSFCICMHPSSLSTRNREGTSDLSRGDWTCLTVAAAAWVIASDIHRLPIRSLCLVLRYLHHHFLLPALPFSFY